MYTVVVRGIGLLLLSILVGACSDPGNPSIPESSYSGDAVSDFVMALQAGDRAKVDKLLDADSTLLELRDEQGQSPLHYAVLSNSPAIVELLIARGMDPNVQDNEGRTPLTVLEDSGFRYEDVREALLDHGGTN